MKKWDTLEQNRVFCLAKERFFWPGMRTDIDHYVNRVCRCLKQKKPSVNTREPQQSITTTAPFELVSVDQNYLVYSIKQYYINYTLQHNTVCIENYDCKLKVENYPSNSYTRSNKGWHVIYCTPCQAWRCIPRHACVIAHHSW